jgi:outer membrane autotransporter protein
MSNHTIPSRLKGLSLAVAQVVAVTGAADAAAVGCSHIVTSAAPVVISSDVTGSVCTDGSSPSSVTLSSGATLTAASYASRAVSIRRGSVELESSAQIINEKDSYSTGISVDSYGSDNGASVVTLGTDSIIRVNSNTTQAKGGGANARAISAYSEGAMTIDLGAGTSVDSSSTSAVYAEGEAISVQARGTYGVTDTVTINAQDATVFVSAAVVNSAYFEGASRVYAEGTTIEVEGAAQTSVDLGASSVSANTRAATEIDQQGSVYSVGIDVESTTNQLSTLANAAIELDDTAVDVDAYIAGEGYGEAVALGISSSSDSEFANATSSVDIHGGSVDVAAFSDVANDDARNLALSVAIGAGSDSGYGQAVTLINIDEGAEIAAYASGPQALAMGITSKYSGTDTLSIVLNDASLEVGAEGYGGAVAAGIVATATEVDVLLTDADIVVSANQVASDLGGPIGRLTASGILAGGDDVNLEMTNSSVTVNVPTAAGSVGPGKYANGIVVYGGREAASVTLNNSSVIVNTPDSITGVGIYDYSDYGAVITLDSGSRIEADLAVYSGGEDAQLINAGRVVGDVDMRGSVDNSGTMIGRVEARELTVRSTGVVAGTADVHTLDVAAGGELQVILTDEVDPESAHFTAVDATLADGSKVHLNATSDLYNPDIDGIDYLVVDATNSLIADTDAMLLNTSGLISADWVECGSLSLCVSVRALELEEIAIDDGSSTNGVGAAGAAQSVLEELSGTDTETADTFLELIERVVDDEAWEELDGSGQGENLLASRDAERVVSRYVQRLMQQGRSSGEEFSAAQGLWIQALQTDGDGDSDNGVAGFEVDTTGFAIGYDRELRPGLVIGGVVSSADTEVESDDNMNRVDTDTLMASIYGQWTQGPLFANAVMTYGRGDNDSRREVVGDIASADYDSDFLSLRIQGGKEFGFESGWKLSPRVEVAYNHVNIDSYDESGSVAALSVASQSYETLELGLGLEIAKPIVVEKAVWTPYFDLAVYHDFADDQVQSNSRFVIGGNSFVTTGSDVEQTNISATLGLSYSVGANHSLKAAYEYFGNSSYDSASWMLRYSYGF